MSTYCTRMWTVGKKDSNEFGAFFVGWLRGPRIERMHFMHIFFILNQERYVFFCSEKIQTPALGAETIR